MLMRKAIQRVYYTVTKRRYGERKEIGERKRKGTLVLIVVMLLRDVCGGKVKIG